MDSSFIVVSDALCSVELVRKVRHKLASLLKKQGELESQIDDLLLAVTEHLANLAEHGENVQCDVLWYPEARTFECRDTGASIASLLEQSAVFEEQAGEGLLQESGMGLSLIKTLFPDFQYTSSESLDSKNRLRLSMPLPRHTIAVVDDDSVFLALLTAYLEDQYEVITFDSALSALNDKAIDKVSLVIADMHMPDLNGMELRERLLDNDKTAMTPFIFLTGDESSTKRQNASDLQIDDYLTKPISKAHLVDTIKRVLLRSYRIKSRLNAHIDTKINSSLWPKGPWNIGAVKADYAYAVAERGGGDFLFHQELGNKHRFVLGDVMGHGEQAKFYAFAITGFLSGLCAGLKPSSTVSSFMNQLSLLIGDSELMTNTLVTLQVIDIDEHGQVDICSAGHPPPLLMKHDDINELDVEGPLPGMDETAHYLAKSLVLTPGDALVFYTDGLTEALLLSDDAQLLKASLAELNEKQTAPLCSAQIAENMAFEKRLLDDDVSVFTLSAPFS